MIVIHTKWEPVLTERLIQETGEQAVVSEHPDDVLLSQTEVLLTFGMDGALLAHCPNLKFLYSLSAGVDDLPFAALQKQHVVVANSSGVHISQMSEQILGVMIGFSRNLFLHRDNQNRHVWELFPKIRELNGSTLLIIGAGRIGQAVAKRAKAFDMRVIGLKNGPSPMENFDEVWETERLHDALPLADYVVLLTPLTAETKGLMNGSAFAQMKSSAVFLNYSRGGTVELPALIDALQNGVIRGAGLDVFPTEPLPADSPLWSMPNAMLTPHIGGKSEQYNVRALDVFLQNYRAWKEGKPLPTQIDLVRGY